MGRWDGADTRIDSHISEYTGSGRAPGASLASPSQWPGYTSPVRQVRSERHRRGSGMDDPRSRTIGSASASAGAMTARTSPAGRSRGH